MVRPLLEIEKPWLTRDDAEAAVWRLTGTRNTTLVEQLLRVMDIYAVSQGPSLIGQLKERDRARERWKIDLSSYTPESLKDRETRAAMDRLAELEEPDDQDIAELPYAQYAKAFSDLENGEFDFSIGGDWPGKPTRAAPVWKLPDGSMFQQCSTCGVPKDYSEFHKDSSRWNMRNSQCKPCKNAVTRAGKGKHVVKELVSAW